MKLPPKHQLLKRSPFKVVTICGLLCIEFILHNFNFGNDRMLEKDCTRENER